MAHKDWDGLTASLVQFPAGIVEVDETGLFMHQAAIDQYRIAAHWMDPGKGAPVLLMQDSCNGCRVRKLDAVMNSSPCQSEPVGDAFQPKPREYCFPILYAGRPLALLRLILKPGAVMEANQNEILVNICEVMAIALKAGIDRQTLVELRSAETSLVERRKVSQYLHDTLGPNLGYMRIKLDQLISEKKDPSRIQFKDDLIRLRDAAAASNEILRGILETNHPETTPVVTNLLREHARKVSLRANFMMDFEIQGEPLPISPEVGQAVFFAFQELLNNVEKYSEASRVHVLVKWGGEKLEVTVSDNGKGFNPQAVNHSQHFGLEIMQERIARLNGQVELVTAENSGTSVTISLPGLFHDARMDR
jgi:signal transduction histidine kinase